MQATYSPEDNKLRLYTSSRLDTDTHAKVKAAGFIWAPKQELFVAPMWTPEREDLLIELCGDVGDEDTSLVERAEERSERFGEYSDSRREDAEAAHKAVSTIADGIPLGQPILVGHHSERHARRDAEKIQNGMRRAVKMWETANYWKSRAAGAIHAAKYKEWPDVRARRIKGLEADLRSYIASYTRHPGQPDIMQHDGYGTDAPMVPYAWVGPKGRGGSWVKVSSLPAIEARAARWIAHIENRLTYERAMLEESGGTAADRFDIQVGGRVLIRNDWVVVLRVNKSNGVINSVTTTARYVPVRGIEEVKDYRPPTEEDAAKVQKATKLAPICNFHVAGCLEMTSEEWKKSQRWSDTYQLHTFPATEATGAYRQRCGYRGGERKLVFLTDAPLKIPPAPEPKAEPVRFEVQTEAGGPRQYREPERTKFDTMRESLKAGVQVVNAPQLFPTPPELARRMVLEADITAGQRVLEPSAGTGSILRAVFGAFTGCDCGQVVAVEINSQLAQALKTDRVKRVYANESNYDIRHADFLACNGALGEFDRIVMNPPFTDSQDIAHVRHAFGFLKPGGRLVAIMSEGPFFRQDRKATEFRAWLEENSGTSEKLPTGTFKTSGTGASSRLVVVNKP